MTDLPPISREMENILKPKIWDLHKYYKYSRVREHGINDYWGFKNKLESMFNLGELLYLELLRMPNDDNNLLGFTWQTFQLIQTMKVKLGTCL